MQFGHVLVQLNQPTDLENLTQESVFEFYNSGLQFFINVSPIEASKNFQENSDVQKHFEDSYKAYCEEFLEHVKTFTVN